jgi:CHAT domain-containing protein/Flp pilus assembly protein TadD
MVWPFGKKKTSQPEPQGPDFVGALRSVAGFVMGGQRGDAALQRLPGCRVTVEALVDWVRSGQGRDVLRLAEWRRLVGAELGVLSEVAGEVVQESEPQGDSAPVDPVELEKEDQGSKSSYISDIVPIKSEAIELFKQGLDYYQLANFTSAIDCYTKAIQIDPNHVYAYNGRGIIYSELKKHKDAIFNFTQVIKIDSNYIYAYNSRGIAYSELKRYNEAINDYSKVIEIDPHYAYSYCNRGISHKDLQMYEEAITDFNKAIQIDSKLDTAYLNRGIAYSHLKDYTKAIADFTRAIALHLDNWQAWANRGLVLFHFSGYQAALDNDAEGLKHLDPHCEPLGCATLHWVTGLVRYQQGQTQPNPRPYFIQATQSYNTAYDLIEANPLYTTDTLKILRHWIKADRALGDHEAANQLTLNATQRLDLALKNVDPDYRKVLRVEFHDFYYLNVDRLISENKPWEALIAAEQQKSLALDWLRNPNADPQDLSRETLAATIKQLCPNPQTAILYWHLSPAQINTFLLRPHQDPEIITTLPTDPPFDPATKTTTNFTEWLKHYKTTYQNSRKQKDNASQWRDELPPLLKPLPKLLNIPQILAKLDNIQTLILIPHRDLHLLPLHALLNSSQVPLAKGDSRGFRITYRPNLTLPTPNTPLPTSHPPTLIGHPTTAQPLQFARLETALIHHLYPTAQPLTDAAVTQSAVIQALQTPAPAFHFTGHAAHDAENPEASALSLANDEPFTLQTLDSLDKINIPLVCLAACETGIANQGEFIREFVGFPAVFLKQGSRYVLSTLWTVSEESSMIFIVEFFRHYQYHNDPVAALHHTQTQLQTLTWRDLAQWYRDAYDPQLKRTTRDWLRSLASNIEDEPGQCPPAQTPYNTPYHWAGFILTTAASQ